MLVRYTASIVDALQAATRAGLIAKSGMQSIRDNKAELAACVHTIEDYAFPQVFGDFVVTGEDARPEPTPEQEIALYEAVSDFCLEVGDIEGFPAPMRGTDAGKVNWREFIKTYLPMVLEILMKI